MSTINERVAHCRRLANLTQTEAAERMGMKCSTYSQMERKGNITAERLLILAKIFDVDPEIMLYGEKKLTESTAPVTSAPQTENVLKQKHFYENISFSAPFICSKKEENLIKIIRNLPKNERNDVIAFIEQKYKDSKK